MPIKKFSLNISVSTSPPSVADDIAQAFETNYGDRGSDETLNEYLSRHLEQYVLSIYGNSLTNAAISQTAQQVKAEIDSAATIRKRKDKPSDAEEVK